MEATAPLINLSLSENFLFVSYFQIQNFVLDVHILGGIEWKN